MTKFPELKTVCDYLRYATSRFNEAALFYGHGTDNGWDEALALILHSLHLPHSINQHVLQANLLASEQTKLMELINQRVDKRIPVPYLTHEAWFAGLSFYVDERVLIPRSPMAEMIEQHFEPWVLAQEVHNILDLCTGSGCIAIACAKAFPEAHVDAGDISADALTVAKMNVLRHNVEDQVELYHSDLFNTLPHKQYDIIISNPPYVDIDELSALPPEYRHEPQLGLTAGQDGLSFVTRILETAGKFLSPQGILVVEVGNSEAALIAKFPDVPFTWLEFQHSVGGVFLLTAEQVKEKFS